MFTRHPGSPDQSLESGPVISFQLCVTENFTTPIHISKLQAQTFAWKTRIKSLKGILKFLNFLLLVIDLFAYYCVFQINIIFFIFQENTT